MTGGSGPGSAGWEQLAYCLCVAREVTGSWHDAFSPCIALAEDPGSHTVMEEERMVRVSEERHTGRVSAYWQVAADVKRFN